MVPRGPEWERQKRVGLLPVITTPRGVLGQELSRDVERDQDVVQRVGEPGRQRGGLAEVLPEAYEADATVSRSDLLQPLPRAIRRAGVDIDHFVPAPHRLKRVAETS